MNILVLVLALSACSKPAAVTAKTAAQCVPQAIAKKTPLKFPDGKSIAVDVADTPDTRETGLMCVTKLPKDYGMLFAFPNEMSLGFWMKHTLVSLDILWIDAEHRITTIAPKLKASKVDTPDDKVARAGGRGQFVLELAAGEAAKRKLKVGDALVFDVATPEK